LDRRHASRRHTSPRGQKRETIAAYWSGAAPQRSASAASSGAATVGTGGSCEMPSRRPSPAARLLGNNSASWETEADVTITLRTVVGPTPAQSPIRGLNVKQENEAPETRHLTLRVVGFRARQSARPQRLRRSRHSVGFRLVMRSERPGARPSPTSTSWTTSPGTTIQLAGRGVERDC